MDPLDAPLEVTRQVGLIGLAAAAALAVVCLAGRRLWPRSGDDPLPLGGIALAIAAMVAISVSDGSEAVSGQHVAGVALAGVGAGIGAVLRTPTWTWPPLMLPGAAVAVDAMHIVDPPEVISPTIVGAAVLAALVHVSDRIHRHTAVGPLLLWVSICGMYGTIPETDQILPVLVVATPIAIVGWPLRLARLGAVGSASTVVLLAAIVAEGGQDRPASILGGIGSFGVLALEPLVRSFVRGAAPAARNGSSRSLALLVCLHLVMVMVASRVAGLRDDSETATAILGVTVAFAVVALAALIRQEPQDDHG